MSIVIYTKTGCPYCAAAKKHYTETGVDFVEKNVTEDPAALEELVGFSPSRFVPTIVAEDGTVTMGWNGGG